MIPYYGDFAEDATVRIPFNTFSSDDPTASVTITNLADADIKVHKDGGLTQIATDGATIAIDYDGITGNHMITIDTSVHADYTTGADYQVRIEGTTVDAGTINAFVGTFSIQNRYNAAADDLANVTDGLGALRTLLLDIPTVSEFNARTLTAANYFDPATDTVANVTTVATCITNTDMRGTDNAATASALATVDSNVDAILVDTGTTLENHLTDIKGGTFSGSTDSLEAIRNRGDAAWTTGAGGTPPQLLQSTTIATLASQTSFTLTAGSSDDDAYNGAVVVVTDQSTATQKAVGSVSDYTGSTKTVTLSADPAIFTMAVGDTIDVIANASTAPSAAAVRAEMDANSTQLAAIVADTNELQTDWVNGGRLDLILDSTATASALATVDTNVDAILVDTGTTLPATLSDMSGTTFNTSTDSLEAIRNRGDAAWTTGAGSTPPTVIEIRQEMDANSTQLAAIVADTNELQTDWVNGGRLDLILDATATQTSVDTVDTVVDGIQTDLDNGTDGLGALKTAITAVETDTQDIQSRVPASLTSGRMNVNVQAINNDTDAVDRLQSGVKGNVIGTVGAASTVSSVVSSALDPAGSVTDQFKGKIITFKDDTTTAALRGQATDITASTASATPTFTVTALTTAPVSGDTFTIT